MRPSPIVLALAFGALGSFGCGSDGAPSPPSLDAYFKAEPYALAACNRVDQKLVGQRQMRLYVNGDVPILPATKALASYYHRHSLSFFTDSQPQATTMAYALDTSDEALGRALVAEFPGVDLNDEVAVMADPVLYDQVLTFVANFILRPMVDFANAHSDLGPVVTNLIVVPQIERPGGEQLLDPGQSLAGLAVSPALLAEFARGGSEEPNIWEGIRLTDFTPIMVLGDNVLARARSVDRVLSDIIIAHEFGHTGGLIHSPVARNLMFQGVAPGINDCTDNLDDAQLNTLGANYGVGQAAASGALLAHRPDARPPARPSGRLSSFTPDRLRAMLGGDRQAMRTFVELLFHHAR